MNWYYVHAGKQMGPVDEFQLSELRRSDKIQDDTLIWREGMENWRPYAEAGPRSSSSGEPPLVTSAIAAASAAETTQTTREAVCAGCGKIFEMTAMTQFGANRVCAVCKPAYARNLADQARAGQAGFHYAGFWIRWGAVFLDSLIIKIVLVPAGLLMGMNFTQALGTELAPMGAMAQLLIFQGVVWLVYETFFIGKYGATPGKMACKIKVITAEGTPVSYPLAAGRFFAKVLSAALCMIGYLIAGFDPEKRALHDRLCNTRVVFT